MNPAAPMKPPMDGCDRFAAALARLGVCPGDRAFVSGAQHKGPPTRALAPPVRRYLGI